MPIEYIIFAYILLYFIPTAIAVLRSHHHKLRIFLLNLLSGWSVIGWVASLIWSLVDFPTSDKSQ